MLILLGLIKHYTALIDSSIIEPAKLDSWKNEIEQYPDEDVDDIRDASELLTKINNGEISDEDIGFEFFSSQTNSDKHEYIVKDNLMRLMFKFVNDPQEFQRRLIAVGEQKKLANVRETIDGIYNEVNSPSQKTYSAFDFMKASAPDAVIPSAAGVSDARGILNGKIIEGKSPCEDIEE